MILVIDNYDSFTYNLVQELGEMGADLHVVRNTTRSLWPKSVPCSPRTLSSRLGRATPTTGAFHWR